MNEQTLELKIKTSAEDAGKALDKLSGKITKVGKALSFGALFAGGAKLAKTMYNWMDNAVDRTEQLNLFNVVFKNIEKNGKQTFSELGKEATRFQNKLNEVFGTNLTETTKYQALFQSMGENVGIGDKYSAIMSETMSKLTYDLASLYNKSEKDVAEALRAGVYAGQTKPLRAYGVDVTQTTLTPVAQSLGITDRSVKEMSQAEKEILRYIATLRQAKVAMGDFANTIDSPANQLKILRNQLVEVKVAISSLFMGMYAKILPYANAILMVIKEIAKAIGTLFGIKISDYNTGIATQEEAFEGINDSIGEATDSAKKLKRELLSFDQVHNINEDTGSSSGSGASALTGGIDQRLLDAIKGYDNGMDKVRMKATEIRDKIMEWLGFTKYVNEETGETYFKFENTDTALYKIVMAFKDIIKYGKEAISGVFSIIANDLKSGFLGQIVADLLNVVASIVKLVSKSKTLQQVIAKVLEVLLLYKALKMIPFIKNIVSLVGTSLVTAFKGLANNIKDSKKETEELGDKVKKAKKETEEAKDETNKWSKMMSSAKTAVAGLVTSAVGLVTVHESMKNIANEGPNVTNVLTGITGALSTIGGMASIGSVFGPIGTAIGACVGAVSSLITGLTSWSSANDTLGNSLKEIHKTVDDYNKSMSNLADERKKAIDSANEEYGYYQKLWSELKNIVDENGKIKTGYEERATVITGILSDALGIEISIVDGVIQKYGDLETSIQDVINAKKAESVLNAYQKEYDEAMSKKRELQEAYNKAVMNTANVQNEYDHSLEQTAKMLGKSKEETEAYIKKIGAQTALMNPLTSNLAVWSLKLEECTKAEQDAGKAMDDNQLIISNYYRALEMMEEKHYDAVLTMFDNTVKFNGKTKEENERKYKAEIAIIEQHLADLKKRQSEYTEEEYKALVESYELQKEALTKSKDDANTILDQKAKEQLGKTSSLMANIVQEIISKNPDFKNASEGNMNSYNEGLNSGQTKPNGTMNTFLSNLIQKVKDKRGDAVNSGIYLLDGINSGLANNNKQNSVFGTITNFAGNMLKKFKDTLGINSPSKLTKEFGEYLVEGISVGINSEKTTALNNVSDFANDMVKEMNTDLGRFVLDFNNMVSNPTINGNINNHSTVSIGDDMASKISSQIAMAINGQVINVQLDAHTDEGVIIDRINQTTKQTGVCPITIPY